MPEKAPLLSVLEGIRPSVLNSGTWWPVCGLYAVFALFADLAGTIRAKQWEVSLFLLPVFCRVFDPDFLDCPWMYRSVHAIHHTAKEHSKTSSQRS